MTSVPFPPSGIAATVEQRDGRTTISGPSRLPAEIAENRPPASQLHFAEDFLDVWTCGVIAIGAFGVLSVIAMVAVMLLTRRPLIVNGRPLGMGSSLLLALGFIVVWLAVATFMASGGRSMRQNVRALAGEAPPGHWTLSLSAGEWVASEEFLGASKTRRCDPRNVRNIVISAESRVVAEIADPASGASTDLPLTGPVDPPTSDWLRGVLSEALGRRISDRTDA